MNNIKKYLIGFIIGLSLVGTFTYAASRGNIGALFVQDGTNWFLLGDNIKSGTITKAKLHSDLKDEINANTAKVGITSAQSNAIAENTAKTVFSGDYNDLENTPTIPDVSNFYTKDQVDAKIRTDEEINTLIDNKLSCTFDGSSLSVGSSVTAYQNLSVNYGESCVSETRECTSGGLTGTYSYSSCSVLSLADANDCITIGGYCKGGKYAGNNIIVQINDSGFYGYWNNAVNNCENSTESGYSDWRLPNENELNTLYIYKDIILGFSNTRFWSSTTDIYSLVLIQNFLNGIIDYDYVNPDYGMYNVRCVRSL